MDERKRDNLVVLIILILTAAFLVAVIIYAELNGIDSYSKEGNGTVAQSSLVYIDCLPERAGGGGHDNNDLKNICLTRGCLWKPSALDVGPPSCQYPDNVGGYNLKLKKSPYQFVLSKNDGPDLFGNQSVEIGVNFTIFNNYSLRVLFFDVHNERFQVPKESVNIQMRSTTGLKGPGYIVEFCNNPWGFRLIRKNTKVILFDTCGLRDLTFSSNFVQLTARIASENIYGLGERRSHTFKRNMDYERLTLWARNEGTQSRRGSSYGQQPFYLNLEENGNANGVLLLNSNAMEIFLQPSPAITFRTTGGVLDFYFFLGPQPDAVIEQYVSAIGRPSLPPYWALGFHLGYNGTHAIEQTKALLTSVSFYNISQDAQWLVGKDYTYFNHRLSNSWSQLPELIKEIHEKQKKCVLAMNTAIPVVKEYSLADDGLHGENRSFSPYLDGLQYDVFVKNSETKEYFLGNSWPVEVGVHFPDFTHPNSTLWMMDQLKNVFETLNVDGLSIISNEPLNFNDENNYINKNANQCSRNPMNWPPFIPSFKGSQLANLYARTLCMDAVQHLGHHYDIHGLYGHSMSAVMNKALKTLKSKKRPFLVTESNFVGTGHYAFHIHSDYNIFSWENMRSTIISMLEHNLFGMPFSGSTLCGERLRVKDPLCLRWTALGAFYSFTMAVVDDDTSTNNSSAFEFDSTFTNSLRAVFLERYRLLPYLYTLLYYSHATGAPAIRPLMFSFPKDNVTWNLDSQFLWGSALMFSPVLEDNVTQRDVYYPDWRMYDYFDHSEISVRGRSMSVPCNATRIIVNSLGGTIIPLQIASTSTYSSRQNPIELFASLNDTYEASGSLFLDDYESDNVDLNIYLLVKFNIVFDSRPQGNNRSSLTFEIIHQNFTSNLILSTLTVLGCPYSPVNVSVVDKPLSGYTYNKDKKSLQLNDLNLHIDKLSKDVSVTWFYAYV